jgi:ribosomal-protein-alanine N-acetyltransferase
VGWISSLAVAPGFRRQGIARELLRRCELELSTRLLRLALRRTNEGALALYLSEGYHQLEVWPAYYRDGEDGLVMGKPGGANKG